MRVRLMIGTPPAVIRVPRARWHEQSLGRWIVSPSVAARPRSRATTATARSSRSARSRAAWAGPRRRSRPTSTIPPARRPAQSRRATAARAAPAERPPAHATASTTPTPTATAADPAPPAPQWTRARVRDALHRWAERYGRAPSSYDWSRTHARRRGDEALQRLEAGDWPAPATVTTLYGTWARALIDAFADPAEPQRPTAISSDVRPCAR